MNRVPTIPRFVRGDTVYWLSVDCAPPTDLPRLRKSELGAAASVYLLAWWYRVLGYCTLVTRSVPLVRARGTYTPGSTLAYNLAAVPSTPTPTPTITFSHAVLRSPRRRYHHHLSPSLLARSTPSTFVRRSDNHSRATGSLSRTGRNIPRDKNMSMTGVVRNVPKRQCRSDSGRRVAI